jgi:hypothetical protein
MRIHTTHTRDAALRELHRLNRWLVAASVLLTGALTDVAAHAFPGKKLSGSPARATRAATKRSKDGAGQPQGTAAKAASKPLAPPAEAPQAANEASSPQQSEVAPAQESAPAHESAPAQESVPAQEPAESAPAQESPPSHESAPASEPTPEAAPEPAPEAVVSGGS